MNFFFVMNYMNVKEIECTCIYERGHEITDICIMRTSNVFVCLFDLI